MWIPAGGAEGKSAAQVLLKFINASGKAFYAGFSFASAWQSCHSSMLAIWRALSWS